MSDKELRDAGLKVTVPRIKILEILASGNPHHMSAEAVHKAMLDAGEDVGLATIYRVLAQFEAAGLVQRHNFEDNYAVFELDQGEHHDHMVCVKCGHVEEFLDLKIEVRQDAIAKEAGFEITDHKLTLYGICRRCA